MLSFFMKKKQSTDSPPEEIIQGPSTEPGSSGNVGDDFIFVEKKGDDNPSRHTQPTPPSHMYPPIPPRFGEAPPYPTTNPYLPHGLQTNHINASQTAIPYVQDVPFVLAPQLCIKNTFDLTQTEVDGILALLTRQMSVDESEEEYSFALERAIQNECY